MEFGNYVISGTGIGNCSLDNTMDAELLESESESNGGGDGQTQQSGGGFNWGFTIVIIALFVILIGWFFLSGRKNKAGEKEYTESVEAIRPGNKVTSRGGICGVVVEVCDDNTVILETGSEASGKSRVKLMKECIYETDAKGPTQIAREEAELRRKQEKEAKEAAKKAKKNGGEPPAPAGDPAEPAEKPEEKPAEEPAERNSEDGGKETQE